MFSSQFSALQKKYLQMIPFYQCFMQYPDRFCICKQGAFTVKDACLSLNSIPQCDCRGKHIYTPDFAEHKRKTSALFKQLIPFLIHFSGVTSGNPQNTT